MTVLHIEKTEDGLEAEGEVMCLMYTAGVKVEFGLTFFFLAKGCNLDE